MIPSNFIDHCAGIITDLSDDMDFQMALTCAHVLIGSITGDRIFLRTHKGELSADIMAMILAKSGSDKTIALNPIKKIIKNIGVLVPASFTTESISDYFAKKKIAFNEKGKIIYEDDGSPVYEGYLYPNYGLIPWDEASRHFSESRTKNYMSGIIELLSSIYNHSLDSAYFKTHGVKEDPQSPYVSLFGNMVTEYFQHIPPYLFAQGIAGRFHWVLIEPKRPKGVDEQADWNNTQQYIESQSKLDTIENNIITPLNNFLHSLEEPIIVTLDNDANKLIKEFKAEMDMESYSLYKNNELGSDYQYLKRLPEMAAKAALRYAIADYITDISSLKMINGEQMKKGIAFARSSHEALQQLLSLNNTVSGNQRDNKVIMTLRNAKNGMLTTSQWRNACGITNPNTFQSIVQDLIDRNMVRLVDKSTITDEEEMDRLNVRSATKIYQFIRDG